MGMQKKSIFFIGLCMLFANLIQAQKLTFAEVDRDDKGEVNFEIIGKLNGNFLVYKNARWKHKVSVYNNEMKEIERVNLDFLPEKTFNVDVVAYPDYFFMIYQYQKKNILHCMAVKMDAMAKKMSEPVEIDTTKISFFSDNKIYNTIVSENKEKVAIFKLQKKDENYALGVKLFNKNFELLKSNRQQLNYNDRRDSKEIKEGNRTNSSILNIFSLSYASDTLTTYKANLDKKYIDNVNIKIDNLNNRYIINSFYYKKARGSVDGIYSLLYDKRFPDSSLVSFLSINDSLRSEAKRTGQLRYAFDNFFIKQVIVKKDGGYVVVSEDFTTEQFGNNFNNFNRWNSWNSPFYNPSGFYYNPYLGYYRSPGSFNNNQITRFYYNNIFVTSFTKTGNEEWSRVFQKDQSEDDNESFLSFSVLPFSGELHFLYNIDKRNQIIADNSINVAGTVKRNPPLKTEQKGHQFMPRFAKQVAAKQFIMPCDYRGFLTFVKIDMP
jgi:hypothetical protein